VPSAALDPDERPPFPVPAHTERRGKRRARDQLLYLTPDGLDEEPDGEIGDLTTTELANAV
jgi:hypothetical protein